jgi:phenazine biosynthesis protein phzE
MDASLLLRVAYLDPADGSVRIPVGATLVRGSDPYEEVRETRAKAAGVLRAFGVFDADDARAGDEVGDEAAAGAATATREDDDGLRQWADDPRVLATLAARNEGLAPFWLREHASGEFVVPELLGRSVLIVDNEDAFTSMLTVQLRALGLEVTRTPYAAVDGSAGYEEHDGLADFDLVVLGPGPGDPRDLGLPKVRVGRALIQRLFAREQPVLGVCLGHQFLCAAMGFELVRRPEPNQGTQVEVDLYGRRELVGYYNSFAALAPGFDVPGLRVATLPGSRELVAMRGPGYAGVQFHAESVFSLDGLGILRRELGRLLA